MSPVPRAARSLPWLVAASLVAAGLTALGCATTVKPEDSAVGTCQAICVGQLTLSAADGRDDFGLAVFGEGFTSLEIGCPDNLILGGPAGVTAECVTGGAVVTAEGVLFPDPLYVTASIGTAFTGDQSFSPDWTEETVCGTSCRTGALTFELPETGR